MAASGGQGCPSSDQRNERSEIIIEDSPSHQRKPPELDPIPSVLSNGAETGGVRRTAAGMDEPGVPGDRRSIQAGKGRRSADIAEIRMVVGKTR